MSVSTSRNITVTIVRQVLTAIVQLLIMLLIAKNYGTTGNGIYAMCVLFPTTLFTLLNSGITSSIVYHLAGKHRSPSLILKDIFLFFMMISLCGLLIGYGIIKCLAITLFPGVDKNLLLISLTVFPFMLLNQCMLSFFQGLNEFKYFNLLSIIQPIFMLFVITLLIYYQLIDIEYLIISYVVSIIGTVLCGFFMMFVIRRIICGNADSLVDRNEFFCYGLRSQVSNIITFFNYRSATYIINFFLGPSISGIYFIAVQIIEKLWVISNAVCTVLLPRLCSQERIYVYDKVDIISFSSRWIITLTILTGLSAIVVFEYIVLWVIGDEYKQATHVLIMTLPGVALWAGSKIMSAYFLSRDLQRYNIISSFYVFIANTLISIIFIPIIGLYGAALATLCSYSLDFIYKRFVYSRVCSTNNSLLF
ncbi:oligosaccharide flippase family protein, partial [Vibrio breoganii]